MKLKKSKPITPSLRHLVQINRSQLWKNRPLKSLTKAKISTGGRNNTGRITSWHRGGGHKQLYRIIDFKRNLNDISATVTRIEYDPNRTSFIALLKYENGQQNYIISPQDLKIGDKVMSSLTKIESKNGNCMPLEHIQIGAMIHNIEMKPGGGGKIARSAGSYAQLLGKSDGYARISMRSSEVRNIPLGCKATIGVVSNEDHQHITIAKAGRNRWLGRRPTVRGVAMNPVDHPHGGGEGKTSGGRIPVTPWGKKTKGKKTRMNKRTQKFIIKHRKK